MCLPFFMQSKSSEQFAAEKYDISPIVTNSALIACGYPPKSISSLSRLSCMLNTLSSRNEAAMLLAHIFHETGGLKYVEEVNPGMNYCSPQTNKSYHGRGLIMLSWIDNYSKAGKALGLGSKFVDDPDLVKEDVYAVETAGWYWKEVVRKNKEVGDDNFVASTMSINGDIESKAGGREMARHRYELYCKVARCFGVVEIARR